MTDIPEWVNKVARELYFWEESTIVDIEGIIIKHAPPMPQWHPASEPPEPFKTVNVAVCRDGNNIARIRDTAIFDNSGESGGRWRLGEYAGQPGYTVTHWMDLIPLPAEDKE